MSIAVSWLNHLKPYRLDQDWPYMHPIESNKDAVSHFFVVQAWSVTSLRWDSYATSPNPDKTEKIWMETWLLVLENENYH